MLRAATVAEDPALARRDDEKAVGIEDAAIDGDAQLAPDIAAEHVELRAAVIAVLRLESDRPTRRAVADDVDDAAHRVVAVQTGGRSIHDLDAIDAFERHEIGRASCRERV